MNKYAIVAQYLIDLFKSNGLVNTIIFGAVDERDLNKENLFPLVHIMPNTFSLDGNMIDCEFTIAVVGLRHKPNTFQEDKIFGDNLIDNLNETAAILIKELTKLNLQINDLNIDLVSSTNAQAIVFQDANLLDGFEVTVVLSIPNDYSVC